MKIFRFFTLLCKRNRTFVDFRSEMPWLESLPRADTDLEDTAMYDNEIDCLGDLPRCVLDNSIDIAEQNRARDRVLALPELVETILVCNVQDLNFSWTYCLVNLLWNAIATSHRFRRASLFTSKHIIERIVEHMGMRDLLQARHVCRSWKEVIASNARAQAKLFMDKTETDLQTSIKINPAYSLKLCDTPDQVVLGQAVPFRYGSYAIPGDNGWSRRQVGSLGPKMFITQPPSTHVTIKYGHQMQRLFDPNGVTVSLVDAAIRRLSVIHGQPFYFALSFCSHRREAETWATAKLCECGKGDGNP